MTRTTTMTRLALVAVLSLTMIGAWGCRRRPPVTASGALSARYERTLIRTAARDTGCPAGQLTPMQVHVGPQVWSVTGCASPVEYWLQCSRRNRCSWRRVPLLNESAAATLQCPPQAIQQQPSPQPNVRFAAGCGRQQPFTVACNGAGCGWAPAGPIQGGQVAQGQPQQGQQQPQTVTVQVTTPSTNLQSQIEAQREAILSCIDTAALTLTVRWTSQGQVILQLPPELAGTVAEACIQAAVGSLTVAANQAGEVVIPLQQ
ncbi:MAG: hypothetical protein RLO52_01530 [Sandaracinaceae bacterium]